MPKSRLRKRTATPLVRIKNLVRGAADPFQALSLVREAAPVDEISGISAWATRCLSVSGPMRSLRPQTLHALHSVQPFPAVNIEREVRWTAGILESKISDLSYFSRAKRTVEDAALSGNVEVATQHLDDIDHRLGYSLWSISVRIGLLQLYEGIEAQKEFVSTLRDLGAPPPVLFFGFWWSVRAEEDTTPSRFLTDTERQIRRQQLGETTAAHLNYHLRHEMPPPGLEADLLAQSAAVSLIDLYEAFVDVSAAMVSEDRDSNLRFGQFAKKLSHGTSDWRLRKIAFLAGDVSVLDELVLGETIWRDAEASGVNLPASTEYDSLEEAASAVAMGRDGDHWLGPVWDRTKTALDHLGRPGQIGERAKSDLARIGLALGRTAVASWCRSVAIEAQIPAPIFCYPNQVQRYVSTPYLDASILPFLSERLQREYANHLLQKYGSRPSILAAQVLAHGANVREPTANQHLSARFLAEASIITAFRAGQYDAVLKAIETSEPGEATRLVVQAEILALLRSGQMRAAVCTAVSRYLNRSEFLTWLPLDELATAVRGIETPPPLMGVAEFPILMNLLFRHFGPEYDSQRAYACEDFLASMGAGRPSEIVQENFPGSTAVLVHFLAEVCTTAVLKFSTAYGSEKELEDERIQVCRILALLDPERADAYEDEARELVRTQLVRNALKELQRSKVSIDSDALHDWAERQLKEDFERYKTLLASGIVVVDEAYKTELLRALETGQFPKSLYEVPENEASALFARVVTRFIHECGLNSEHGLDCYLSLRVRHGTLSGLLRGPVDYERLVTRREAGTGEYRHNEYWLNMAAGSLSMDELALMDAHLRGFSSRYDLAIAKATDELIQIKREDKPAGLFQLALPAISLYGLATEVDRETPFEDFIGKCFDTFWTLVEVSLGNVRSYIDGQLRGDLRACFDDLERDLADLSGVEAVSFLSDAIRRARSEVGLALDQMKEWFVLPTATTALPFSIDELVHVALATIQNFHRDFNPNLTVHSPGIPPIGGALRLFSDIFFVLFENIHKHSGLARPEVEVTAIEESGMLRVSVRNNVRYPERHMEPIEGARQRIKSGAYRSAVRREGGTGLPKLAKLISDGGGGAGLEFVLDREHGAFTVTFALRWTEIAIEVKEDQHETVAGGR